MVVGILFLMFTSVTQAQPPSQDRDLELGISLAKDRNYTEAARLLESATKTHPNNVDAWYYLGLAYLNTAEYDKALVAFETTIKLDPKSADAHVCYALTLMRLDRLTEATSEAAKAFAINPSHVEAARTLGVLYMTRGMFEEAIKHAETAMSSIPTFSEGHLVKALALQSFYNDEVRFKPLQDSAKYRERWLNAVESLTKYVEKNLNADNANIWREQIESLKFYLKADYSEIKSGKEVSTRARLISKPEPRYTEEARLLGVTGTIVLTAVFAADGTVKHILVLKALPGGLTEQAIRAAKSIRLYPATFDGKPVPTWIQLEYNFNLY